MRRLRFLLPLSVLMLLGAYMAIPASAAHFASPSFEKTWARTDMPVAQGVVSRTWIWAPDAFTGGIMEEYEESPNGMRLVQYFDKSRMEITHPDGDQNSIWYVTNGLLATELITGEMQLGDDEFDDEGSADVNVAGDANDPNSPTYDTFEDLLDESPQAVGSPLINRVNRDGDITPDPSLQSQGIVVGAVDDVTNHSIAAPFWEFMNSSGTVYENGQYTNDKLFENPYFATGRPITEPYWADVLVGGIEKLVLMQCMERRCMTYTPSNDPNWRVEMGNIGQHYYAWRYEDDSPVPASTN